MNLLIRSFKAVTTVVLTAVLLGIGSDEARAVGQGHGGGGGHAGGGFAHGGYGGYGGRGGYGGYGGYGRGWGYGGWGGWGWGGFGWGLGLGLGLGWAGYPYYGYGYGYPYYGYGYGPYAYGPYAYGGYPYPAYSAGSSPGPGLPTIPVAPAGGPYATPAGAMPSPPGPLPVADITLLLHTPTDAVVWINGIKTNQTGPNRQFVSSGLDVGRTYTFDLRAQWTAADGTPKEMNRKVHVLAGDRSAIDLMSPSP